MKRKHRDWTREDKLVYGPQPVTKITLNDKQIMAIKFSLVVGDTSVLDYPLLTTEDLDTEHFKKTGFSEAQEYYFKTVDEGAVEYIREMNQKILRIQRFIDLMD